VRVFEHSLLSSLAKPALEKQNLLFTTQIGVLLNRFLNSLLALEELLALSFTAAQLSTLLMFAQLQRWFYQVLPYCEIVSINLSIKPLVGTILMPARSPLTNISSF